MIYPASFLNYCETIEIKMTSLRKSILFILWNAEKPLKAYEVLEKLLKIKENAMPPTVYRVLDYLVDSDVIHKIESIQSYKLCHEPEKHYPSEVLMVCDHCHQVKELYDGALHALVQKLSQEHNFHLGRDAIELRGSCKACSIELAKC